MPGSLFGGPLALQTWFLKVDNGKINWTGGLKTTGPSHPVEMYMNPSLPSWSVCTHRTLGSHMQWLERWPYLLTFKHRTSIVPRALIRCRTGFQIALSSRDLHNHITGSYLSSAAKRPGPKTAKSPLTLGRLGYQFVLLFGCSEESSLGVILSTMYCTNATCLQFSRCSFCECFTSECLISSSRDHT